MITAIDFETTGTVYGYKVEAWQIGLVCISDELEKISSFESYLYIAKDRPFNKFAPGRHASLREILSEAPTMDEVWGDIKDSIVGNILLAHNCGTENKMLKEKFPLHNFGNWIDTLKLSRLAFPNLSSYALEDLIEVFDIKKDVDAIYPSKKSHDALYDAEACYLLFKKICSLEGWKDLSLEELMAISKKG